MNDRTFARCNHLEDLGERIDSRADQLRHNGMPVESDPLYKRLSEVLRRLHDDCADIERVASV